MDDNLQSLLQLCCSDGDVNAELAKATLAPTIEIKKGEDLSAGWGIFIKDGISQVATGTLLMRIPFALCISTSSILKSTPIGQKIEQELPDLLSYPDEILALGLMYAKKYDSEHQPTSVFDMEHNQSMKSAYHKCLLAHVKTLPTTFNTTIYWSDEEVDALRPNAVYHLTKMMQKQIDHDWENIHQPLTQQFPDLLGHATKDLYRWALSVVYSRAIGIHKDGEYVRCIPPLLDMANHSPEVGDDAADTFRYDEQADEICLVNTSPKSAGDECFAVYGTYPNAKLAHTYGFVVLSNPHRAIDLWTRVTPNVFKAQEKQQILQSSPLTRNQTYDFEGTLRDDFISPALLATIRIIQANDDEEMANVAANALQGKMISVRNELATYASLKELILARMKVETAEADKVRLGEMLLSDGLDRSNREYMALVIRVEERELLQDCLALISSRVDELSEMK